MSRSPYMKSMKKHNKPSKLVEIITRSVNKEVQMESEKGSRNPNLATKPSNDIEKEPILVEHIDALFRLPFNKLVINPFVVENPVAEPIVLANAEEDEVVVT
ncbi:hypothetical protein GOBAR_AA12449 [Gossypium barbadense]|uniref:Uncharacterized protein n=1 Tax=Gossypium barbadense TaxID=3634 RepID=A0A2P5XXY3_GOSBA|nr:hypothetical protein GOBAR_AA12449 [Gossypium barbadense]